MHGIGHTFGLFLRELEVLFEVVGHGGTQHHLIGIGHSARVDPAQPHELGERAENLALDRVVMVRPVYASAKATINPLVEDESCDWCDGRMLKCALTWIAFISALLSTLWQAMVMVFEILDRMKKRKAKYPM